ncbi:MAG: hypothetical protein ACJ798_05550 [Phenylobacterium sp.]
MSQDREHLDLARRHMTEGKARVEAQQQLIGRLEEGGHSTVLAQQLLDSLVETLIQMRVHRDYLEARALKLGGT